MNDETSKSPEDLIKNEKSSKSAEDLIISFKFLPMADVSGIVLAKRALLKGKPIDVVQNCISGPLDNDFNEIIEELIVNRIIIKNFDYGMKRKELDEAFSNYIREGLEKIERINPNYKTITTRTWGIQPVFLALEYKLKHPETEWTAEYSDPIIFDLENKVRSNAFKMEYNINNKDYLDRINAEIDKINERLSDDGKNIRLEHISEKDNLLFLSEYLGYVFADKVRFTNVYQREIMLSQFPYDIKDFVMEKSEINPHPTLDEKYYHIKEVDYSVDDDCINIGYFGTYFGKRNFETIFYAIDNLDEEIKSKIKLHLFTLHGENLPTLTNNLSFHENIIVNEKVSLLEFLNLSTKLDVLLVNDTETKGNFKVNPYRPSKIADYIGSKNDIWGICEKNSIMDSLEEIKYKSYINDFYSAKAVINQIVDDYSSKLNLDPNSTTDEMDSLEKLNELCMKNFKKRFDELNEDEILEIFNEKEYLMNRLNHLNHLFNESTGRCLFPIEVKKLKAKNNRLSNNNKKLRKENKKLKDENKKLKKDLKFMKTMKGSIRYHGKNLLKK